MALLLPVSFASRGAEPWLADHREYKIAACKSFVSI
jgi:hypothetical protein